MIINNNKIIDLTIYNKWLKINQPMIYVKLKLAVHYITLRMFK
jgi:hypothetical protein